jgi:hypothetical protein
MKKIIILYLLLLPAIGFSQNVVKDFRGWIPPAVWKSYHQDKKDGKFLKQFSAGYEYFPFLHSYNTDTTVYVFVKDTVRDVILVSREIRPVPVRKLQ